MFATDAPARSSTLTGAMVTVLHPLLATDTEFFVTFGIFVLAMVVLAALIVRWAVRHDRAGFTLWRQRQQAAPTQAPPPGEGDVPPTSGK